MMKYLHKLMIGSLICSILLQSFDIKLDHIFMGIATLILFILIYKNSEIKNNIFENKLPLFAIAILAISLLPSVIFSSYFGRSFHQYLKVVLYWPLVFLIVVSLKDDIKLLEKSTFVLLSYLIIDNLYAFYKWYEAGGAIRGTGFEPKIVLFGVYTCMYTILFYITILDKNKFVLRERMISIIGLIICVMGIIASGTRTAWLSIIICFPIIGIPYFLKSKKLIVFILSLFIVGGIIFANTPYLQNRFASITNTTTDYSNAGRIYVWKGAAKLFLQQPLTGIGLHTWKYCDYNYYNISERKNKMYLPHAHNNILNLAAEGGIFAVLGYCFLQLSFVWMSFKNIRKHFNPYDMMLLGVVLVYNFCGIFDDLFSSVTISRIYWYLLAFLTIMSVDFRKREQSVEK